MAGKTKSRKNDNAPILLTGDDQVSKESFIEQWMATSIPAEAAQFDYDSFDASETKSDDIIASCLALPMLAPFRCVLVRHLDKMSAAELEILARYLADPSPSTLHLFETESPDRRQKSWQKIVTFCRVEEFKVPYPERIPAWIAERCRSRYNRRIDTAAAQLILDCVGTDLGEIDSELGKLDVFVAEKQPISVEDVEKQVGARAENVFEWIRAIGEKDCGRAFQWMDGLFGAGAEAHGPLALLGRHFHSLLKIRLLQKERLSEEDIAARLHLNAFFHFKKLGFGRQAKGFAPAELESALDRIVETERLLKSSSADPRLAMESLVFAICRQVPVE